MNNNESPNKSIIENSWLEYKQLVIKKFAELEVLQTKVEDIRIDLAVLKSKTAIISAGIAFVFSTGITLILRFLK